MATMKRHIQIATIKTPAGRDAPVVATVEWDGKRLSISAVEGPKPNGDCYGSCGQMQRSEEHENRPEWYDRFMDIWERWHLNDMRPNCQHQTGPEWEPKQVNIYHFRLTDEAMRAASDAKKAAESALKAGETFTPTPEQSEAARRPYSLSSHLPDAPPAYRPAEQTTYSRPVETKATNWLRPNEHPDGYLTKPCPVCGYKYGSAWLHEDVPQDVIDWLFSLPPTTLPAVWAR